MSDKVVAGRWRFMTFRRCGLVAPPSILGRSKTLTAASLALVLVGGYAGTLVAPAHPAREPSYGVAAPGLTRIQHVIVIVQENRSFDTYFGTYPGADGIPRNADGTPA